MKHIRLFFLSFLLCFCFQHSASASRLVKGFEALEIYDYFKAKSNFEKSLKRYESPASFGLARIYLRKDNPFHSIDSAYYYILRSHASLGKVKEKQLEKLIVFGFSASSVLELRQSIAAEFFVRAEKENTALGYQKFMDDHSWANEME